MTESKATEAEVVFDELIDEPDGDSAADVVGAPTRAPTGDSGVSRRPVVAVGLIMAGLALSRLTTPWLDVWIWLIAAGIALAAWIMTRRSATRWVAGTGSGVALAVAVVAIAAAWGGLRAWQVTDGDLAGIVGSAPRLWRVEGRVATTPVVRSVGSGGMARYGYEGPRTYFQLAVDRVVARKGSRAGVAGDGLPLTGRVLVRIDEPVHSLKVGDRLRVTGMLRAFPPAHNPGQTDRAELARTQRLAGILNAKTRGNVTQLDSSQSLSWRWRRWRASVRAQATGWILRDLPSTYSDSRREALLAALLLGDRSPSLDGLDRAFQRIGLAHLLSISGLHLAVLVGTAMLCIRLLSPSSSVEWILTALLVLGYLFVVPGRIPVWRSGVMMLTFIAARATGRRLDTLNVLSTAAAVVLIWRPSELVAPGFQLSFGVVLALVTLTNPARSRLFGVAPDIEMLSVPEMAIEHFKTIVAATMVAWLASMPLVAYHFAVVCPLAAVISLVALPLVLIVLATGYTKALTALLFPSLGVILAPVLAIATDGLAGLVVRLDALPWTTIVVGHPGIMWTIAFSATITWWIGFRIQQSRRWVWFRRFVLAILAAQLALGPLFTKPLPWQNSCIITMLSVGNGSCYIIQQGQEAVLYDAGSGRSLAVGQSTIVPALRRLGVLKVRALIISHADMDHYAGALEVMSAVKTDKLIVTPQLIAQASRDPLGPVAWMVQEADRMGIAIRPFSRGDRLEFGDATLTWIHPEADQKYATDNDQSAVVRLEVAGRSVLFTGDVTANAIAHLMRLPHDQLQADVLELPHHGSWSESAAAFMARVDPEIILQSTGRRQLPDDPWAPILENRRRFVTAINGAVTVEIGRDGEIAVHTTLDSH